MAKFAEVTPTEKRYTIEVSAAERKVIAEALLHYRNINYYCENGSSKPVREAFMGQTSRGGATTALEIIQAIRV